MPITAISIPARAGPKTLVELNDTEFNAMAFIRCSRPTSSTVIACLLGASKAMTRPLSAAKIIIWLVVIHLACVNAANPNASSIKDVWVIISRILLFALSARTPPNRESRNMGMAPKKPTSPKRNAEFVNWNTNQLRATDCIQVPVRETIFPNQ